jgi:3',5'-nucleoside bisphosphate phosphatase
MSHGLLLCELHAHTTWSDGHLSLSELVDLHGRHGFDVLAVTDHSVRLDDPMPAAVDSWTWPGYLAAVRAEVERAHNDYGLLVIPGLELTDNDEDPERATHVLALGLSAHVSVDNGIIPALHDAQAQGSALIAAHPYDADDWTPLRSTRRIARERHVFERLVHRYELFNRDEIFSWVAHERLPVVATGDVHRAAHLSSWKTLLPCEKNAVAVVDYLRSSGGVFLMPFAADRREALPLAA